MSKKISNAKRAAKTRSARDGLYDRFGYYTYSILERISTGKNTNTVYPSPSPRSVAAFKANLARGTYSPFVTASGGTCNF